MALKLRKDMKIGSGGDAERERKIQEIIDRAPDPDGGNRKRRGPVTFPVHLPRDFHARVKEAAFSINESLHSFVVTAIDERLNRLKMKEVIHERERI
jgi:predicted HicB family RNase H-like nuclease